MPIGITDFTVFSRQPVAEKAEIAVHEILETDPEIIAFADDRVHRLADPFAIPDLPTPCLMVSAPAERRDWLTGNEAEQTLTVSVGIYYDENRTTVDPSEVTVKALIDRIIFVLASNPRLENTVAFGPSNMVDRLESIEPIGYARFERDDNSATIYLQLEARYRSHMDAVTGEKT